MRRRNATAIPQAVGAIFAKRLGTFTFIWQANGMANNPEPPADPVSDMIAMQTEATRAFWTNVMAPLGEDNTTSAAAQAYSKSPGGLDWAALTRQLQNVWGAYAAGLPHGAHPAMPLADPARWQELVAGWWAQMPLQDPVQQQALWGEGLELWQQVLGQYDIGPDAAGKDGAAVELPRSDKRFRDEKWRTNPAFALIHQTYLLLAERLTAMADAVEGLDDDQRARLRFATRTVVEALSPDHFPMTNPVVMERTLATGGQNLVQGLENLIADLSRGQLTHTDGSGFELGINLAATPGKVIHETPLYQLIQYMPTTDEVLETPLVIFPPWINRFYILDLNPKKSFVGWCLDQGISVFMVSWKSADASMAHVVWDDYIAAQIEVIDHVRARLDVPDVHTIGYCVAGTTLAATLAVLEAKGHADKVRSATFFTAQVDFEEAGELKVFVDDGQLATLAGLAQDGFIDGRYLAATFNLLRGTDLIWNYVTNNYLLGEEYPAFDLLQWNGDVTNLPARWHQQYLRDLYRDNMLVKPGAISALGEPIDLTKVKTPSFIQAGREDHIAPPESVLKLTHHFAGPTEFVLAGSGHIAGVVNPPAAKKYQYWVADGTFESLADFVEQATELPGSWWPHWFAWLTEFGDAKTKAKGKRKPGGKKDDVIEDAPGRYVKSR